MLTHLIADYSRDPELRRQFDDDPDKVLEKYKISDATRQLLAKLDVPGMVNQVSNEVQGLLSHGDASSQTSLLGPTPYTRPMPPIEVDEVKPPKGWVNRPIQFRITGSTSPIRPSCSSGGRKYRWRVSRSR